MKKYLAFDGINGEFHGSDTIDDARKDIVKIILDPDEGYHPDLESCAIYELKEKVSYDVEDVKSNYKYENDEDIPDEDEESEAWPYSNEYDEIWNHKFVPVGIDANDEYFDTCIDTFLSGDFAHCEELFNTLAHSGRKDLIRYIDKVELPKVKEFYFNLL